MNFTGKLKVLWLAVLLLVACIEVSMIGNKQEVAIRGAFGCSVPATTNNNIPLTDMQFDFVRFARYDIRNRHPLGPSEIQKWQVEQIDKLRLRSNYINLQYYVLRELYKGKEGKVVLISRIYQMENSAWLASYDPHNKLVGFKTVFYNEFALNTSSTTSFIKNNQINIRRRYLDVETDAQTEYRQSFQINMGLQFVAINS